MSYGIGCRHGSDPTLLWLWCRPVATAPIGSLAWEPPYAAGAAPEKAKKTKKTKTKNKTKKRMAPMKETQMTNAAEGMEKREPSYKVGGNVNWYNHYGGTSANYT